MTSRAKARMERTSGDLNENLVTQRDATVTGSDAIVTLDDNAVVTFRWVGEQLGIPSNTIVRRYFPDKILPVYEGLECPSLRTENGKLTGFGAKAIARYTRQCIQGGRTWESWRNEVRSAYNAKSIEQDVQNVIDGELVDDDQPISSTVAIAALGQQQEEREDSTQAAIAMLLYKQKEVNKKRAELAAITEKKRNEELLKKAIDRKMADLQREEAELDAEMQAELIVQQLSSL